MDTSSESSSESSSDESDVEDVKDTGANHERVVNKASLSALAISHAHNFTEKGVTAVLTLLHSSLSQYVPEQELNKLSRSYKQLKRAHPDIHEVEMIPVCPKDECLLEEIKPALTYKCGCGLLPFRFI